MAEFAIWINTEDARIPKTIKTLLRDRIAGISDLGGMVDSNPDALTGITGTQPGQGVGEQSRVSSAANDTNGEP